MVAALGYSPASAARGLLTAVFGGANRIAAVLLVACPLLLTGLAVCAAFRCGVWNIGAEGQYLVGALAAAAVGALADSWPVWIAIPAVLAAAVIAGAVWAWIAAWLKLTRGVQEVLSTILLNFIALQIVNIAVRGPLTDPSSLSRDTTAEIARASRLPLLTAEGGLHVGILFAVLAAVALWFFLAHTVAGLRIRIAGANPIAARRAGLRVTRYVAASFLISGALAGLAGGVELSGNSHYLTAGYGAGYGYTAIAIALLARLSPLGVIPAALFFAALDVGVRGLQFVEAPGFESIPTALTYVAQGTVVLAVALLARPPKAVEQP